MNKIIEAVKEAIASIKKQLARIRPVIGSATAMGLMAIMVPKPAEAQYQPNFYIQDTNAFPLLLNNSVQSFTPGGTASRKQIVRQNTGISIFLQTVQTNSTSSTTTNYVLAFEVSHDGTNFTSGFPTSTILWTNSYIGGISTNLFWTNLPPSFLSNVRSIQCTRASTTAGVNVVATLWYSYSNQ